MTTKELTTRLKSLSDANKEILTRISKLSKLVPDQESHESTENRVDLSEEIHENLKELETEFELLQQEAESILTPSSGVHRRQSEEKGRERNQFISYVDRLAEDLKSSRAYFRRASLQAKRNEQEAERKTREQLFASATAEDGDRPLSGRRRGQNENRTQDEIVLSAAGDVTAGLRRTHSLMTQELERSRFAHETLQNSTKALSSLNESYTGLDDLLKASRSLVSTLVSSQKSDTWYLESAIKILLVTLVWLIFRRWFCGPILLLIYKPSRFMFGVIYSALNLTLSVLTGTIFQGGQGSPGVAVSSSSSSRKPLIIKPSAGKGGIPKRDSSGAPPVVKVGLGGGGSAEGRSAEDKAKDDETLPEQIVRMAEKAKEQERQMGSLAEDINQEGSAGATTGDGTVLRERTADEKPNPKKRMMEEPPVPAEEAGSSQPKDEL